MVNISKRTCYLIEVIGIRISLFIQTVEMLSTIPEKRKQKTELCKVHYES